MKVEELTSLYLPSTARFNRSAVSFGIEPGRFDRAAEALWLAAERLVRWAAGVNLT
jgi:hypothetical protein